MLDFIVCGSGFKAAYTALKLRQMYNKAKISIKSKFFGKHIVTNFGSYKGLTTHY